MQVKLEQISEWITAGLSLGLSAYAYAPISAKNHFARGKEEFVIWCSDQTGESSGIGWIKDGQWTFIPSPAQKKNWNQPLLLDTASDILIIGGADQKAWRLSSPDQRPGAVECENWCAGENITEIPTLGENGNYPVICRVDGEVFAANSFTFLHYDNKTSALHWEQQITPVFTTEKTQTLFQQSLVRASGVYHQMDFRYAYPQIGALMLRESGLYAFLEADIINPCGLSSFKYYWYLELTRDGVYRRKIWGEEKLDKRPGKHGMRGKFSACKEYLILSPVFKTDEWKGKQKLLRLFDRALLDIALPRGCAKFRVMDIWQDHVFISDERDRIALCRMTEQE